MTQLNSQNNNNNDDNNNNNNNNNNNDNNNSSNNNNSNNNNNNNNNNKKLFPEEQKGCRKGSRGTNDLLQINMAVINDVKSRNKNLPMAWIDYKKAYDMVPHS